MTPFHLNEQMEGLTEAQKASELFIRYKYCLEFVSEVN
jgi:hypothetical protein